jgi:hypothetical protein
MRNIAIFGSSVFGHGPWRPGKKVWSIAFCGASTTDFRQAQLDEGTTSVVCLVLFGAGKVLVSPEMPVTLTGLSVLGVRSMKRAQAKEIPPISARGLQVRALCLFGAFQVTDKG